MTNLRYVESADGTKIALERVTSGPEDLVLVPGSVNVRQAWAFVAEKLDGHYTCWLLDRRGKGDSGDTEPYDLEREADDLVAVAASFDRPVGFAGHSSGAVILMMAAARGMPAARLVLYEPPWLAVGAADPRIDTFSDMVDAGDRDGAFEFALREMVQLPAPAIAGMKASPAWSMRMALLPTWPREMRSIRDMDPAALSWSSITAPTLLLDGGASGEFLRASTAAVATAVPHATVTVLPGQGHFALVMAPDLVAGAILAP